MGTKLYMIRYVNRLLHYAKSGSYAIIVRGIPRGAKKLIKELFLGRKRRTTKKRLLHISYIIFTNKYKHNMTQRAVKKRLKKKFESK